MPQILEKVERRLGEKLFLKGERCVGPKCAAVRRSYPPGVHGAGSRRRGRNISEYGQLLRDKQKLRYFYGLDDADIRGYVEEASRSRGLFSTRLIGLLEGRLDNMTWRFGFAPSHRSARQLVGHGHITVNGRVVSIPSYRTKSGDRVGLTQGMRRTPELSQRLQAFEPPPWLEFDKEQIIGTVRALPENTQDVGVTVDLAKIKELYLR